jgi:stage II sporulation protein M
MNIQSEWIWIKKTLGLPLFLLFVLFVLSALFTHFLLVLHPQEAEKLFSLMAKILQQKIPVHEPGYPLFLAILKNNLQASLLVLVTGLVPFLFIPVFAVLANGAGIGVITAVYQNSGLDPGALLLFGIAPHGLFEIPAFLFSAGIGLHLSIFLIKLILVSPPQNRPTFLFSLKRALLLWLVIVVPLIIVAALVETFFTPALVQAFVKLPASPL